MIGQVKVQWKHLGDDETTWEMEETMREAYPFSFKQNNTEDNAIIREGECNTPGFKPLIVNMYVM